MQDEFDRFKIYATGRSSVPVTNITSLAILDALEPEDKTLSDISCELGLSTSTVFFNLKGLIKSGLVISYPDELNKKKVLYALASVKIIESTPCVSDLDDIIVETVSNMVSDDAYFFRGLNFFSTLFEAKTGVSMAPAWNLISKDLAKNKSNPIKSDKVEELFAQIIKFFKAADMPEVSVFSFVPLVVVFRVRLPIPWNLSGVFASCVGFIEQALEDNLHVTYGIHSTEVIGSEQKDLKMTFGRRSSKSNYNRFRENFKGLSDPGDFIIVHSKGGPAIITNDVQIRIMRELESGDCTLATLSERLNTAQSTIFVNLSKMMERGIIASCKDSDVNLKMYSNNSDVLLSSKVPVVINDETFDATLGAIFEDPSTYFENILYYLQCRLESAGVDVSGLMNSVGRNLARSLFEKNMDKSADEFLSVLSDTSMPFGGKVQIISHMPLTLNVKFDFKNSNVRSRVIHGLYDGLFETLFSKLLGTGCKVMSTHVDSPKVELQYSIRPTL